MADEILIFDAAGSNADGSNPGSPLLIGPGTNYGLLPGTEFPAAPQSVMYAGGADTEGEAPVSRRYGNRTLTIKLNMTDPTGSVLAALQAKYAKLQREGGTLKRTMKDGSVRIYDVIAADGWNPSYDFAYWLSDISEVEMQLPAAPLSRGTEVDLGDNVETTLPALVFSEAGIAGEIPALARLVIDNDASLDWWGAITALEVSTDYDATAASAALFYQAESRTPLGGSAIAAGTTGASGTGSNVVRNTALAQVDAAILSTQASGGGAHLTHVGSFRVYARVQVPATNTGLVSLRMEWAAGDFAYSTPNPTATIPTELEGIWALVDLGIVTISAGTTRWEGRIVARSTVLGDDIDIDSLFLFPTNTYYGVTEAVLSISTPTAWNARDEFDQVGPTNLNGLTAPVGGAWATTGSTTDLSASGVSNLSRGVNTDTGLNGRLAVVGSALTTTVANVDVNMSSGGTGTEAGLLFRYVDASNYGTVFLDTNGQGVNYRLVVAGSIVASGELSYPFTYTVPTTLMAYADTLGNLAIWAYVAGTRRSLTPSIVVRLSQLATGGTLASGKTGIRDFCSSGSTFRAYDNFASWAPIVDAGCFAGQSLEIRSNNVLRENATGAFLQKPARYVGGYLRVPPSGAEARTVRAIVKPLYQFEQGQSVRIDDRIDDLSARLFITPRYLT